MRLSNKCANVKRIVALTGLTTTTPGNVPVVFGAFSYDGALTITVVADPDACPEVDAVADDLRAELDAIRSPRAPAPIDPGPAGPGRGP